MAEIERNRGLKIKKTNNFNLTNNGSLTFTCPHRIVEYEAALQLTLAGASTAAINKLGQLPMVLTEDATMLRLLASVGKHTEHTDIRGVSRTGVRNARGCN